MRKLILLLLTLLCIFALTAACAETVTFPTIGAACEIDSSKYILITPSNLDVRSEWLAAHGMAAETAEADMRSRGVLLQAWSEDAVICFEVTAVADSLARDYYDIDEQTPATRARYRSEHKEGSTYKEEGYSYSSAEWKKTKQGRFLMLKYKRTTAAETYRGFARRTIKNGYTITLDYQVHGRSLAAKDNTALNKIWNTWQFVGAPQAASGDDGQADTTVVSNTVQPQPTANLRFETTPPRETSTGEFTVSGTCTPNLAVVAVVMRMSAKEPLRYDTVSSKKGKFSIKVQLPQEGVWLLSVSVLDAGGEILEEKVFDTTTYQGSLLSVNLDAPLPEAITSDTTIISGKTLRATTVQCIVEGPVRFSKQIRTNGTGVFRFKLDTSASGQYTITLVLSKKNYDTRRYQTVATRSLTEEQQKAYARANAIKPSYVQLSKKVDGYIGRIMTYQLYVTNIVEAGDEYIVFMAMRKADNGVYMDSMVVTAAEDPGFELGSVHTMYGTCVGTYQVQDSYNGDQYLPCFDLLFWE